MHVRVQLENSPCDSSPHTESVPVHENLAYAPVIANKDPILAQNTRNMPALFVHGKIIFLNCVWRLP